MRRMGQMVEITLEIDADLKEQVEAVFAEFGTSGYFVFHGLTKEVVRLKRFPFELDDDLLEYAQAHLIYGGN